MRSSIAVFGLLLAAMTLGCSDGEDGAAVPPRVPPGAHEVSESETRSGEETLFFSSDCFDGVVSVTTTVEVVYAELPCSRALPADVKERFLGKVVALRIVPGEPSKIYMDSKAAGSVEFTVGRIWLAELGEDSGR